MKMASSAQLRNGPRPTGNPPAQSPTSINIRKPYSSSPAVNPNSTGDLSGKRGSSEASLKSATINRGVDDAGDQQGSAASGVAWDWQAKEWVSTDGLPQENTEENGKNTSGPNSGTNSAAIMRKATQRVRQGGWVSELEGISEKGGIVGNEDGRTKREMNALARVRRKGFYVADLQARRKPSQRELLLLRTEKTPKRIPPGNREPLYSRTRDASSMVDEKHMQSPKLIYIDQKGFVSDAARSFVDMRIAQEQFYRTYGSANEIDRDNVDDGDDGSDGTESFHSERSACGMPWHWGGNNNQRIRLGAQVDSAGGCFSATKKQGRRRKTGYKFGSEKSVSSVDSDTESVPLMTDQEHSEDFAASSVELSNETPRIVRMNGDQLRRYGKPGGAARDKMQLNTQPGVGNQEMKQRQAGGSKQHRSLSQKYRPKSFKDLIGQTMVTEALSNAILRDKIAPVYLFHGPRGTGKTTAARIFTAAINCLSIEELRPCGLCKECSSFNAGKNYNVRKVDAGGNNNVESMRQLLTNMSLPPSGSRYKVVIVDDCHTLSAEAWNALLKSLEEPPGYVVFLLITTDPEQLPRTAMSRCQKFMFVRIKEADILMRLRKLALQEKVDVDLEALQFIASRSDGSFRDAENMLDQLSLLGSRITLATVQEMIGLIPDAKLAKLLDSALSADTVSTVNTIRELMESGAEPLALMSQLAVMITDLLAGKSKILGSTTMKVREEDQLRLKQVLKILSDSEKQLRTCSDQTTWLTAAFLQFCPNEPCLLPSSSRGTSVARSPITLYDTSEKEALDAVDFVGNGKSWGGVERWDPYSPLQPDGTGRDPHLFSGPFSDTSHRTGPLGTHVQERTTCLYRDRVQEESNTSSPSTMDTIWRKVVQGSRSNALKQLLQGDARLVSLAVTEAFSIAHLEFQHPESKAMAERARTSISNAFQLALGCSVEVEFSLSTLPRETATFVPRLDNPFLQRNPDYHDGHVGAFIEHDGGLYPQGRRTTRSGSFRQSSSSFRNMTSTIPSPLWQSVEQRRHRQGFEADRGIQGKGSADVFQEVYKRRRCKDGANWGPRPLQDLNATDTSTLDVPRNSFKPGQGQAGGAPRGIEGDPHGVSKFDTYTSDSEALSDRDAPGVLCWKGTKESKAKRRRRRGRVLLRFVLCAKGSGCSRHEQHIEGNDR